MIVFFAIFLTLCFKFVLIFFIFKIIYQAENLVISNKNCIFALVSVNMSIHLAP